VMAGTKKSAKLQNVSHTSTSISTNHSVSDVSVTVDDISSGRGKLLSLTRSIISVLYELDLLLRMETLIYFVQAAFELFCLSFHVAYIQQPSPIEHRPPTQRRVSSIPQISQQQSQPSITPPTLNIPLPKPTPKQSPKRRISRKFRRPPPKPDPPSKPDPPQTTSPLQTVVHNNQTSDTGSTPTKQYPPPPFILQPPVSNLFTAPHLQAFPPPPSFARVTIPTAIPVSLSITDSTASVAYSSFKGRGLSPRRKPVASAKDKRDSLPPAVKQSIVIPGTKEKSEIELSLVESQPRQTLPSLQPQSAEQSIVAALEGQVVPSTPVQPLVRKSSAKLRRPVPPSTVAEPIDDIVSRPSSQANPDTPKSKKEKTARKIKEKVKVKKAEKEREKSPVRKSSAKFIRPDTSTTSTTVVQTVESVAPVIPVQIDVAPIELSALPDSVVPVETKREVLQIPSLESSEQFQTQAEPQLEVEPPPQQSVEVIQPPQTPQPESQPQSESKEPEVQQVPAQQSELTPEPAQPQQSTQEPLPISSNLIPVQPVPEPIQTVETPIVVPEVHEPVAITPPVQPVEPVQQSQPQNPPALIEPVPQRLVSQPRLTSFPPRPAIPVVQPVILPEPPAAATAPAVPQPDPLQSLSSFPSLPPLIPSTRRQPPPQPAIPRFPSPQKSPVPTPPASSVSSNSERPVVKRRHVSMAAIASPPETLTVPAEYRPETAYSSTSPTLRAEWDPSDDNIFSANPLASAKQATSATPSRQFSSHGSIASTSSDGSPRNRSEERLPSPPFLKHNRTPSNHSLQIPSPIPSPRARPHSAGSISSGSEYVQAYAFDNTHLKPGAAAALLSHTETLNMYRQNARKAVDNPATQYEFAIFMMDAAREPNSVGQKEDLLKEGLTILRRLADRGYPQAQYYLADCYSNGIGCKHSMPDLEKAFPLFVLAAKHGHVEASFRTALAYENAWGCRRDPLKAVQFLRYVLFATS
jgi:TPR repeat protein